MPYSVAVGYKRFGVPCCLHLQGNTTRYDDPEDFNLKLYTKRADEASRCPGVGLKRIWVTVVAVVVVVVGGGGGGGGGSSSSSRSSSSLFICLFDSNSV